MSLSLSHSFQLSIKKLKNMILLNIQVSIQLWKYKLSIKIDPYFKQLIFPSGISENIRSNPKHVQLQGIKS